VTVLLFARQSYTARDSMVLRPSARHSGVPERVVSVQRQEEPAACVFANQTKLLLPRFLAKSVAVGDEITFPIPARDAVGAEILVTKNDASRTEPLYLPSADRYVSRRSRTNEIRALFLPKFAEEVLA